MSKSKFFAYPIAALASLLVGYYALNTFVLRSARAAIELEGPSERYIETQLGYNTTCNSMITDAFWQLGPEIPERQGFVCGGLLSQAKIRVVPWENGQILKGHL